MKNLANYLDDYLDEETIYESIKEKKIKLNKANKDKYKKQ